MTQRDTHQEILDTATVLMQSRGYHAFSYADIAERIGIRKASIHYYYPSKSDLAQSVVARYRAAGREGLLQVLAQTADPAERLKGYLQSYEQEFDGRPQMCLCALLAAEMLTLPDQVRAEVQAFYAEQEAWLSVVLEDGRSAGSIHFSGTAPAAAQGFLAGLEGAMLAARAYGEVGRFRTIGRYLLQQYGITA
jgi:TetR/AcrR family transcriptional repressor of nem operon